MADRTGYKSYLINIVERINDGCICLFCRLFLPYLQSSSYRGVDTMTIDRTGWTTNILFKHVPTYVGTIILDLNLDNGNTN